MQLSNFELGVAEIASSNQHREVGGTATLQRPRSHNLTCVCCSRTLLKRLRKEVVVFICVNPGEGSMNISFVFAIAATVICPR